MAPRRPHLLPFHLGCPLTSQPICRCRLYVRAPPPYILRAHYDKRTNRVTTQREATRQRLLRSLMAVSTTASISPTLSHAVWKRNLQQQPALTVPSNGVASIVDSAEVSRDAAHLNRRLDESEAAEAVREAQLRRARELERERDAQLRREREEQMAELAREEEREREKEEQLKREQRQVERERDRERSRMRKRERDRERNRRRRLQREAEREQRERERSDENAVAQQARRRRDRVRRPHR